MCFLTGCAAKPKLSPEERRLYGVQAEAAELGISGARQDIPAARGALGLPQKFFQALLTGDRQAILEALSPEVETIHSQYETGRRAVEEFAPRGGGRTAAMAELPFREAGDVARLVHGARLTGAEGMMSIGQILASLGLGELGAGAGVATQARGQFLTERLERERLAAEQGKEAGEAIGAMIALLVGGGG